MEKRKQTSEAEQKKWKNEDEKIEAEKAERKAAREKERKAAAEVGKERKAAAEVGKEAEEERMANLMFNLLVNAPEETLDIMEDNDIEKILITPEYRIKFINLLYKKPELMSQIKHEIEDEIMLDLVEKDPKFILKWHRLNYTDQIINELRNDSDTHLINLFMEDNINGIKILKTALKKALENYEDDNEYTTDDIVKRVLKQIGEDIFDRGEMKELKENEIIESIISDKKKELKKNNGFFRRLLKKKD